MFLASWKLPPLKKVLPLDAVAVAADAVFVFTGAIGFRACAGRLFATGVYSIET